MKQSTYARRALAELLGVSYKSKSLKPGHLVLMSSVVAVLTLLILIALTSTPDTQKEDCAFRITKQGAPPPVTAGDAVQLNTCVVLEVAASNTSRTLGLSHRSSLPWNRGMLFDFERPAEYCMWMKDMRFSLDMVWLNEEHEIVGMREKVAPETYPDSFCGPKTARYVIEVNGGVVEAGNLRVGQKIRL